jgi:hypothetical protein
MPAGAIWIGQHPNDDTVGEVKNKHNSGRHALDDSHAYDELRHHA